MSKYKVPSWLNQKYLTPTGEIDWAKVLATDNSELYCKLVDEIEQSEGSDKDD